MAKQYDLLLRLLIIGDSGVGKTCLLCRYVDDEFYPNYAATIGIDFKVKNINIGGQRIKVQIWDTAGQERFETITKQYYRRAQGVILAYDISNRTSFTHLPKWVSFIRQYAKENIEITVVGNKTDLDEWRQVPKHEGEKFAERHEFGFWETSAYVDGSHLEDVFNDLIGRILLNQSESLARQSVDSYPSDSDSDLENPLTLSGEGGQRKFCMSC